MRINEIGGKIFPQEENGGKKAQRTESKKDKIEISSQAKELCELKRVEKIESVRKKVELGFYNSDDIISKVAEKIYKILKNDR